MKPHAAPSLGAQAQGRVRRAPMTLVLLTALAIPPAKAAEPLGFKGQGIGSSNLAIAQDPRFECRELRTPTADQVCSLRPREQETIAGVRLISLYYFYDRARLSGITLSLPANQFEGVAQALEGKYGPPRTRMEQVRNHKGDTFENRILTWRQGDALLEAQRFAGRLDRSLIRLSDLAAAERIRQRRARIPDRDL
ncbi:MAG TPA: hypothetical protein PKH69_12710 [Thiobacillaceae bacterium]|nr:hypothetical protein [Thiobacillaceae bacterium]HNU65392.1 hypothetical protein [Thiobacillaceae bacterium]